MFFQTWHLGGTIDLRPFSFVYRYIPRSIEAQIATRSQDLYHLLPIRNGQERALLVMHGHLGPMDLSEQSQDLETGRLRAGSGVCSPLSAY